MSNLKVLFLGVDDPIYYVPFLDRVAAAIPGQLVGVGVVDLAPSWRGRMRRVWQLAGAWGLPVLARLAVLRWLRKRTRCGGVGSMADVARRHGVPFLGYAADCNGPLVGEWLQKTRPDVVVSTLTQKVAAVTFAAVPNGFINTHHGLLPRHAGRLAPFWALLAGDRELGTTFHMMADGIDTGPILAQVRTTPLRGESLHDLLERLFAAAAPVLATLLRQPALTPISPEGRPEQRNPVPTRADVRRLRARGHRYF